jgi:molybdate transport system substrate-binding protein
MNRRRLLFGLCALVAGLGSLPTARAAPNSVAVAAASDLKFVLDELLVGFRAAHPEITVTVSYGSSGNFSTQLQQGAPFDLFLSADIAYPRALEEKGLVLSGSTVTYAVGRLVLWVPTRGGLDPSRGLELLREPAVQHVAIANPIHAPYGRAAEAALKATGLYEPIKSKLVFGDNVTQAATFVQSGAADAGLIALSLALAPTMVGSGRYWELPASSYPRLEQGGCVMKAAQDPTAARLLLGWVAGEGAPVLQKYGFLLPGSP